MADDSTLSRERDFHDRRFAGRVDRTATARYYAVDSGKAAYSRVVDSLAPEADILEIGCAVGSSAISLGRCGASVTGIDISPVAVKRSRKHAKKERLNARFEVMDAHDLSLPASCFDVVCGSGILHHLDLERALPELARVMRADGSAVFVEPLGMNPLINLFRRLTPEIRTPDEHPLTDVDLELMAQWFEDVELEEHTLLALLAAPLHQWPPARLLIAWLQRADRWMFSRVPWTRCMAWTVVLRMSSPIPSGRA